MKNYEDFNEALKELYESGGAMNYCMPVLHGEVPLWQVGTVEEIQEATGIDAEQCTKRALKYGAKESS